MNILFHDKRENKLILVEDASDELLGLAELLLEFSNEQLIDDFICAMDDEGFDVYNQIITEHTILVTL
jgi:hypothetical protein